MVVEKGNGTELRFKYPERLLLVVIAFAFWGVGFIDLIGHKSATPNVFGLYSLPFFIFLVIYGCTFGIWLALFIKPDLLSRVSNWVRYIQSKTWLALTTFVGLLFALWVIFEWDRWSRLPGLQFAAFGFVLLAAIILIFTNWKDSMGQQKWRKVFVYPLFALLILEAILQILAWFGALPGVHTIGGDFVPYERVYYNAEGFRNGFANRYGAYYPDISLDDEKKRIWVVGGSYVQALQVQPEQNLSALLSNKINQEVKETDDLTDVISTGLPGFGLSPFLFDEVIRPPNVLNYDEIIVLFHLGDDFQSPSPSHNAILYIDNDGVKVHPEDARLRHDLTHYYLRGYLSFQLVETIRSNYLTYNVVKNLIRNSADGNPKTDESTGDAGYNFYRIKGYVTDNYALTEPGHAGITATNLEIIPEGNNFIFRNDGNDDLLEAFVIADGILETAQEIAIANDITIRVVTIPMFPEAFFTTFQNGDWNSQISEYDLFLPEEALLKITDKHDIPFLPMGQYMLKDQLSVEEIKALYSSNGRGSFTPQGHAYFAEAIFTCFYSDTPSDVCK